jgi:hypothetical protein
MLHLYALTDHPAHLPLVEEGDSRALWAVNLGGLDAVVSDRSTEATEAAVLEHAQIVDVLTAENSTVLPARFSPGYADEDALVSAMRAREPQLRESLERVRGCVEFGLRVFAEEHDGSDAEPFGSGREYMHRRLESVRETERLADELHVPLAADARDSICNVLANQQLRLTAAYLVPREKTESFRAAVEAAEGNRPGLAFVCTGPWPPYSFAMVGSE